ncbi:uncharacterized protein HD556DRAFT_1448721 [Suillus plorans]|uniref:Uncharacterized protein n=1 Tax=Suillus plorans TaxID=116603 RepID=A0A9P7DBP6_9AGAM|nr:uncharacterized protein HD556DRAFT_1448721 [Suillus plorans]KAG1787532.1 hypothetical protein HD556DRAFT_1448721 [Suillus plorans]
MYSHDTRLDKARRLQDERIKADWNFFLTWDQWVPPMLCTIPSPQKDQIPVGYNNIRISPTLPTISSPLQVTKSKVSIMPSNKTQTLAHPKNNVGHQVFDMCWNTEGDQAPAVQTPTATQSADPQVAGSTFDMCWDAEADSAPSVDMHAAAPLASCKYDLCWDQEHRPPMVDPIPILELATAETQIVDASIPLSAGQYDMCWIDSPFASAVGYAPNFEMCWEDVPSSGDNHFDSASTAAPLINLVDTGLSELCISDGLVQSGAAGDTPVSYDMCFDNFSPAASPAPISGLPSQMVDTGKELLSRANMRLDSIPAVMRDDRGQKSANILDANRVLISEYQHACDQFLTASDDVAKIQHLMNMHCEIDDPLHILLLAMRKMGRGHSPIQ